MPSCSLIQRTPASWLASKNSSLEYVQRGLTALTFFLNTTYSCLSKREFQNKFPNQQIYFPSVTEMKMREKCFALTTELCLISFFKCYIFYASTVTKNHSSSEVFCCFILLSCSNGTLLPKFSCAECLASQTKK